MAERTVSSERTRIDALRSIDGSDDYQEFVRDAQAVHYLPITAGTLRNSSNPAAAGGAKKSLVSIINGELGHGTVTMDSSDASLFEFVSDLQPLLNQKSIAAMERHGRDLINEARRVQDQRAIRKVTQFGGLNHEFHKFARRFLEVTPYETGDGKYDAVVQDHLIFKGLSDAIRADQHGGDKTSDRAAFAQDTAKFIAADVKANLALADLSDLYDLEYERERDEINDLDKHIKRLVQTAAENYVNLSPERQKMIAHQIAGNAAKRVEGKLPEDQRTDYTDRMLREGLRRADQAFRKNKAEGRDAYLRVAKDIHAVVM